MLLRLVVLFYASAALDVEDDALPLSRLLHDLPDLHVHTSLSVDMAAPAFGRVAETSVGFDAFGRGTHTGFTVATGV